MVKLSDYNTVKVSSKPDVDFLNSKEGFNRALLGYVSKQFEMFKTSRTEREDIWLECWAMYLGTPHARNVLKSRILRTLGDVNTDWRHNLTNGKAFEQVETILAYLQQAFFPNRNWFDVVPHNPGFVDEASVIKDFTKKKLIDAEFMTHWEVFLRQLCITGTSVLALPWRYETKRVKTRVSVNHPQDPQSFKYEIKEVEKIVQNNHDFETLDIFDVYFSPVATCPTESDIIRRVVKTRAEIAENVSSGYYEGLTLKDVDNLTPYDPTLSDEAQEIKEYVGISNHNYDDLIEIMEFWGDVYVGNYCYKDVLVTWSGGTILRFENNPFWQGKPFVIGTYTPVVRTTTAMGVIEPTLGLLHELDIITNQRLDNLEISVDSMYEYVDEGSYTEDEIFTQPGKVFKVTQPQSIRPIETRQNFSITYDESAVLEQRIDKSAGTGNLISANTARSGERVTAAEVNATRDAGGNRLSGVHKHVESTSLKPCLDKIFEGYKQFVVFDEVVRTPGDSPGSFDFVKVGAKEFEGEFSLYPVGADHIANKEFMVSQRLTFLSVVSGNPEMSQHMNYQNYMLDLARLMGIDDPEQFINATQPAAPSAPPASSIQDQIAQSQGRTEANVLAGEFQADGGASLMNDTFGINTQPEL